ncbi:MAG: hypothetical protein KQH83_07735 [Actinobacteria bacterium]|nr:hypothetical protein [Actinomycetota bacterium]
MKTKTLTALVLALSLAVAACGGDETAQLPADDGDLAAGTCLEGTPDCNDTPLYPDGEPQDGVLPGEGASDLPSDRVPTVAEIVGAAEGTTVMVRGFYVDTGGGPLLCEALAESFPPQCGGASIPLSDIPAVDPDSMRTEQGTSWSDDAVLVQGQIVGGVLVPAPISG